MKSNDLPNGLLSNFDFTLCKYEELCKAIVKSSYTAITLADYLERGHQADGKYLIMRHDVDRMPGRALGTAQVEQRHGIKATYYFRDRKSTFVPEILDAIALSGHEIGYHYETIDKCKGHFEDAIMLFEQELKAFKGRYKVSTVCAHGNPLTGYDNKDIWKTARLSDFGLLGEAFLSLDFNQFAYFSDSGRTWQKNESQKMPGKDSVTTAFEQVRPVRTDDVIKIVKEGALPNICILTHPERWSADVPGFLGRYLLDTAFSWGKVAIFTFRKVMNNEINLHN
ncbi:MAG: hypothetical protein Q8O55_07780 [Dehalococcoidales bacterium]|nr:hypothetical protein [Dehalococcoidales bacterium]